MYGEIVSDTQLHNTAWSVPSEKSTQFAVVITLGGGKPQGPQQITVFRNHFNIWEDHIGFTPSY